MNINIEAPFAISESDKTLIESKINDLRKYNSTITQASIFFKGDDGNIPNAVLAQIRISVPGNDVFAEDTDKDAIKAFISAYNTTKRMVKKRNEKNKDHQSPVKVIREIVNDNL